MFATISGKDEPGYESSGAGYAGRLEAGPFDDNQINGRILAADEFLGRYIAVLHSQSELQYRHGKTETVWYEARQHGVPAE